MTAGKFFTGLRTVCVVVAAISGMVFAPLMAQDPVGTSMEPKDLFGVWDVLGRQGSSGRRFEFLPSGEIFETRSYTTSNGEMTERTRKRWELANGKILILPADESRGSTRIEIALPFDPVTLALEEVYEDETTTRITRMKATKTAGASVPAVEASGPASPSATPAAAAGALPKIEVRVVPGTKSNNEGYYKVQTLGVAVNLKNLDLRAGSGPLTVNYYIFGKGLRNTKEFSLLDSGQTTCELGNESINREVRYESPPRTHKYWRYGGSGYHEYDGWAVVVSDQLGRKIAVKASKTAWEAAADKLPGLQRGTVYDLSLNPIKGATVYSSD